MAKKLSSLSKNESGFIKEIHQSDISDRLYEFGVFVGSHLTVVEKMPFEGPIYIQIEENRLCLRAEEAEAIIIE